MNTWRRRSGASPRSTEDLDLYELAAETYEALAVGFPANRRDAAWEAGDLYEKRVKNIPKAIEAYRLVPPGSRRHDDAQERIERLERGS